MLKNVWKWGGLRGRGNFPQKFPLPLKKAVLSFLRSFYSPTFETACTHAYCFWCAVHHSFYTSYIRFPGSVCSSYRVGNIMSEWNTFVTNLTSCHFWLPPDYKSTLRYIIPHFLLDCKRFFNLFIKNILSREFKYA